MKVSRLLLSFAALAVLCSGCRKNVPDQPDEPEANPVYDAVNFFAYNCMDMYYLWIDEIQDVIDDWHRYDDPKAAVAKVRYKDANGEDIDKWTMVTDDYESFTSSVAGVSTTLGLDFKLYYLDSYKSRICAIVTFAYENSPASQAGIARGDVITEIDGQQMTPDNYVSLVSDGLLGGRNVSLKFQSGRTVDLVPVKMYEEPVLTYKMFDCGGKRVGYLAYTSFTLDSYATLMEAFRFFKSCEATELILDLRYNSGGYVITELSLASMLAPESEVKAKSLFEQEIYNSNLSKDWADDSKVYFKTEFDFTSGSKSYKYSTAGLNPGIKKIYALVSGDTASASESLLVGLAPYMDIEIIGRQTYGKYCGGIMYGACEWYEDYRKYLPESKYQAGVKNSENWGMYVMISRFADKNGNTPCMPAGFVPDFEVEDHPQDAIPLGDPSEQMLAFALSRAGYPAQTPKAVPASALPDLEPTPFQPSAPGKGVRILPIF